MTIASIPSIFYEFSFNTDPNQAAVPPLWTDLSSRVTYGWTLTRGRQYELDTDEAGTWQVELANTDGALDPGNTASPYWPNVLPYRPCRIRVVLGNNLLTPDQASAGEYAPLAAGPAPAWAGVDAFVNSLAQVASVGASAYQGSRVWSTTVPSGTAGADLLDVAVPQVTAGQTYTFSAQTQATTTGQNPATYLAIGWVGTNGQTLSTTSGSPSTLTGGSGTWTQLAVTGAAPSGAVAALLRVVTTTTPTANSTVWMDGLQLEARGYATRWQMPWTPGTNLLPQTIATGTETMSLVSDAVSNWFTPLNDSVAQATNLTAAPTGATTAVSYTFPSGRTTATVALYTGVNTVSAAGAVADCVQVTAAATYTGSVYLSRAASGDATVQFAPSIAWFNSSGGQITITTGTAVTVPTSGWVRATVTATAPAGAVWGRLYLALAAPSTTTAQNTLYATGWQMEQAASASTWADPGPPVFLFTGLVERWPRTWNDLSGTYGTSKLECVDATAALSQLPLLAPFIQEVLALNPNFVYQLNEPVGSTACADSAGKRIPAPVENTPYGAGSLAFGSSITSTSSTAGFVGTPGPVATFNQAGSPGFQNPDTVVSIHKTAAGGPPPNGNWTRIIHVRIPTTSNGGMAWSANGPNGDEVFLQALPYVNMAVGTASGLSSRYQQPTGNIADGNWHQLAITVSGTGTALFYIDGVQYAPTNGVTTVTLPFSSPLTDTVGAQCETVTSIYQTGFVGDVALAIEFPFAATAAQMTNLYNSWRSASSGESSGARYARILKWIGYPGATSIASGSTQSMGPATDTTGQTPLDALNAVATTENGESYVDAAGRLTFTARSAFYGVRTPVAVFGEGLPVGNAGEWPCEVGAIDFDPSHLANTVQATRYGGAIYTGTDAASIKRYYGRLYQRTINSTSGSEVQDAANYLKSQLKDPHQRAEAIQVHPAAIVGLFPVVAQLDKNARVRYIKRPIGAPSTTLDGFIQRIVWTWAAGSNDAKVEYQVSPADLTNYWRIGALHTTLSAQAASGQANATINALPDAATNKLAQSMPTSQVLWFEPGTPRFEAVTVKTIPTTSVGYSAATLVMNSNFTFTHAAGSVVCEPLPTGYTDPTTWDASSVLGASYAPILSGGAAGTNTVTVGPLLDGAYNAVGSDWNEGDTIWLSSGTANFEAATILSVATTYPGYTSCQITLTANLAHSHSAGEYVSDPLPSSTINPATWTAPTTRAAY